MKAAVKVGLVAVVVVFAVVSAGLALGLAGKTFSQPAYIADDFFIELVENKAELTQGIAVFKIRNPMQVDIIADSSKLTARTALAEGATPTKSLQYYILKTLSYSENTTDYSYTCNPVQINDANGTSYIGQNCSTAATGWHWNNYTRNEYVPFSTEDLKPNGTYTIKLVGTWEPKIGLNSREWFPKIKIGSVEYEQTKWAWWNTSYQTRGNESVLMVGGNSLYDFTHLINGSFFDTSDMVADNLMRSDCKDLQVANSSNDKQNFEWEIYPNGTYGCNAAKSVLWTRMSVLKNDNSSIVSWYYNNPTDANFYNDTTATWNSSLGLVFHFKEGGGSIAEDSTSKNNDGTINGNPTWQNGKFARGLRLDGTGDNVQVTHSSTISDTNWSIEMWAYQENTVDNYLFKKEPELLLANDWPATGQMGCGFFDGTGYTDRATTSEQSTNVWHHIFCKKNGTGIYLYVDGNLVGNDTAIGTQSTSTGDLYIGSHQAGGGYTTGIIDEFRFYDGVDVKDDWIRRSYNYGLSSGIFVENFTNETYISEESARAAMELGIKDVLGTDVVIYTGQQVYLRYLNSTQQLARLDKVTKFGGQIWAVNYVNGTAQPINMQNITPAFYVLELANETSSSTIRTKVSSFINQTKAS